MERREWPPLSLFSRTRTPSIFQATEDFIVHLFEDTNLCAIHARRVTISALAFCFCLLRGMRGVRFSPFPTTDTLPFQRPPPLFFQCPRTCSWPAAFGDPSTACHPTEKDGGVPPHPPPPPRPRLFLSSFPP